jgi:gluconate 2-dehydrogenase gamma chain
MTKDRKTDKPTNGMDRREAIASMGVGAMAAYGVGTPSWEKFRKLQQQPATFFNAADTALLGVLANIIIPRDAKSGSATDSGAIPYMDFVVGDGSERSKTAWRDGLRWFDEEAGRRFNKTFVAATEAERTQIIELVAWPARAAAELRPQVDFFNRLRDLTASAFFSSRMGVEDLGYLGGVVNPEWKGAPPEALRELGVSYDEWDRKYGHAPGVPTGPTTPAHRRTGAPSHE